MKNITLQQRGVLTLPKRVRDALNLSEGSTFNVEQENGSIILRPVTAFDAQLAADIKQGLEDIKKGRGIRFGSIEELHKKIDIHGN
ncbi:AbrB/MazE/SpoVT family DNA-binding domain-containing protein [Candidatus Wolfebacteria bacterium]|nr:AbrB/MazE/SpoVT family DNA-binding domain-containing protein [Candidatus Wolfebacteria bacterium]